MVSEVLDHRCIALRTCWCLTPSHAGRRAECTHHNDVDSQQPCLQHHHSLQGGMELRVLFPAAYKSTWYGRWGYGFGRAGFGIKPAAWKRAVSAVSDLPY